MERKKILWLLPLLFLLISGTYPAQHIRVGIYNNPPLSFLDEYKRPNGFLIDVLEQIADEQGWHIEYYLCEWEACLQALEAGEIDLLGPIAYSEERSQRFDFSAETLITNWGQVYVQSGETNISIVDFDDRWVALLEGDIHAEAFLSITQQFGIQPKVVYFDNYQGMLEALEKKEVFGAVVNHLFAVQFAQDYAVEKSAVIFNPIEVRFAAPKGRNGTLLASLDAQIAALKADKNSLYYQAMDTWMQTEYVETKPPIGLFWVIGIFVFFVGLLLIVNRFLRLQVSKQTAQLEGHRQELELIMDRIPAMIAFVDREQRYIYVDESYAHWYGFEKAAVVGKLIKEVLPPSNYEKVSPRLTEMIESGEELHYEHRIVRRDGKVADVAISYIPKLDAKGKVDAFFASVRDITEEKKAEIALKESEAKYRRLIDNSLIGVYVLQDEKIVFANHGLAELFGYKSPEAMLGLGLEDVVAPQGLEDALREVDQKESGAKKRSQYVLKALRADGNLFDVEIVSEMIQYEGKVAIQGMLIDITERVQAEERFRSLSEASYEALFISEKGICLEQNPAAERMFGFSDEEAFGRSGTEWIVPEDRDLVLHHMLIGYEEPYRVTALRKDGSTFPAEIVGRMMQYQGRKARVTALRDISGQVKAEEGLRESEERYRSIVQDNHAVMLLVDPSSGNIVEANAAASSFYGWTQDELQRKNISEINLLDEAAVRLEMQKAKEGEQNRFFFKHRLANGDVRDVEVHSTRISLYHTEVLHSIVYDISDRVKAEKALRESNQRFERVIAGVPVPMVITNEQSDIEFYNDKFIEIFGYTLDDVRLGKDWWERAYPDEEYRALVQASWVEAIAQAEKNRTQIATQTWDMVCKNGDIRTVEFDMMPLGDISVIAMSDITERVQAENKLRSSKERFEKVISKAPIPMAINDSRGVSELYNDRFTKVFGYMIDDLQDWWTTVYPDERYRALVREEWHKAVMEASETGEQIVTQTWEMTRKDGQKRIVEFDMVPLGDASLIVMNDVTEQVYAERALKEREHKLKEAQVIGNMGHWELDLQTDILTWSEQLYRIFDIDPRVFPVSYSAFLGMIHPDDRELVGDAYSSSLESKIPYDITYRLMLQSGEIRYVRERCKTEYAENDTPLRSLGTVQNITEQVRDEQVMNVRAELSNYALTHSLEELLRKTLDEAENLTDSKIGFYHFVDDNQEALSLQQWSSRTVDGYCSVEDLKRHYSVAEAGVWADCVVTQEPLIHNDYEVLEHRKGLPNGHAALVRELVVPVIRGDKVVAILGVGNKAIEYDQQDLEVISLVADLCWEIAERKLTEEALAESQSFLIETQQLARLGSYRLHINAEIWTSNSVLDDIFGIDESYLRSTAGWLALIHPEDQQMMQTYLVEQVLGERNAFDKEYRIVQHNTQAIRWVHGLGKLEFDGEGRLESMVGTIQDITARVLADKKLKESEARLRTLINATPDIICFKDGQGRWLAANDADLALFELTDVDYVGKKDSELAEYSNFYRESFLTCEETDESAWAAGGLSRQDEIIPTPNDGDKVYDVIKVPLFDGDGSREALVVLGRDITKQVAAQKELRKYVRQLEIVNAISAALSTSLALEELLKTILHQVVQVISCDSASIFLEETGQQLRIVSAIGPAEKFIGQIFYTENTLMAAMKPNQKVQVIDDILKNAAFKAWDGAFAFRGWMGLPLRVRDSLIGYLTFDSFSPQTFSAQDAALAVAFATQVAQAIYNARLYERVIADANDLEKHIQKRTLELQNFVDLTAGREIRMIELKQMIRDLRTQLARAGHVPVAGDSLDDML